MFLLKILSRILNFFTPISENRMNRKNCRKNSQKKKILTNISVIIIKTSASNSWTICDRSPASIMRIQAIISFNSNSFNRLVMKGEKLTCKIR